MKVMKNSHELISDYKCIFFFKSIQLTSHTKMLRQYSKILLGRSRLIKYFMYYFQEIYNVMFTQVYLMNMQIHTTCMIIQIKNRRKRQAFIISRCLLFRAVLTILWIQRTLTMLHNYTLPLLNCQACVQRIAILWNN